MLTESQATTVVKKAFPGADIRPPIVYRGLYIFQVFRNLDPDEDHFDPYYSVNQRTGALSDFSIMTDGDPREINLLFLARQNQSLGGGA